MTHDPLNDFFNTDSAKPSAALMNAILADAAHVQQTPVASVAPSFWSRIVDQLGGVGGLAGLAACACFGVWLGYADIAWAPVFDMNEDALLVELGLSLDDVFMES